MDSPEKRKKPNSASSPPPADRASPPPSRPNGINGNGNVTGDDVPPESYYRPYSDTAVPGPPGPTGPPGPPGGSDVPPGAPQSFPPQQPQQGPPSMTELPPHPTMSTSGSVVSGAGSVSGSRPPDGRLPPVNGSGLPGQPSGPYGGPYGGPPGPPGPAPPLPSAANDTLTKAGLRAARASAASGLELLVTLQWQERQHLEYGPGAASVPNSTAAAVRDQVRLQTGAVLRDLVYVRRAVAEKARAAEARRLRRWLLGSLLAAFVPLVRRLFRRPSVSEPPSGSRPGKSVRFATTDTEYAFARSRSLVDRLRRTLHRRGTLAALALFVLGVLYVFSNEVTRRVARTVGRRLRRLSDKLEQGAEPLTAADVKVLSGWRWRVLLWGRDKGGSE